MGDERRRAAMRRRTTNLEDAPRKPQRLRKEIYSAATAASHQAGERRNCCSTFLGRAEPTLESEVRTLPRSWRCGATVKH